MVMRKKKRKANPKLMAEKASVQAVKARRAARQKPHGGYPTKRTKGPKMQAIKVANRRKMRRGKRPPKTR